MTKLATQFITQTKSLSNQPVNITEQLTEIQVVFDQGALNAELKSLPKPEPMQSPVQLKRDILAKFVWNKYQILKGLKTFLEDNGLMDQVNLRIKENKTGTINFLTIDCPDSVIGFLRESISNPESGIPAQIREILVPAANPSHPSNPLNTSFKAG